MNMLLRREYLIAGRPRDHKEMGMEALQPNSGEWVERDRELSGYPTTAMEGGFSKRVNRFLLVKT